MALGKQNKGASDTIFVDLKFNATKGEQGVGFRQTMEKTPIANPVDGGPRFAYKYDMHGFVSGHVTGFTTREEPTYDDKNIKEFIGYATFSDPEGGPNVCVKFPLASSSGRRVVGLLNAAKDSDPVVHLYTSTIAAGGVIGDKTYDKPAAFINARKNDIKGDRFEPVYADETGAPLMKDGKPQQLAMGEQVTINRKVQWDFSVADDMVLLTASVLAEHYAKQTQSHSETPDAASFEEAAAAAAPKG
jgi:hypothetical protein